MYSIYYIVAYNIYIYQFFNVKKYIIKKLIYTDTIKLYYCKKLPRLLEIKEMYDSYDDGQDDFYSEYKIGFEELYLILCRALESGLDENDKYTITDVLIKYHSYLSSFRVTQLLQNDEIPIYILKNHYYLINKDFLIYTKSFKNTDCNLFDKADITEKDVYDFNKKYTLEFDGLTKKLSELLFVIYNLRTFICMYPESIVKHEFKVRKIRIFCEIWSMYKNLQNKSEKINFVLMIYRHD
jgi:hypothetical protein